MREKDRQLYDEVARDNYGMEVCFEDIEKDLSPLRTGGAITYSHLERIADESAGTMDREKRRKLIFEMQRIIMRDVPYIPLYNPKLVEAARRGKFTGWVEMLGGIGNIWSFCQIKLN